MLVIHPEDGRPQAPPRTVLIPAELAADVDPVFEAALRLFTEAPQRIVLFHAWEMP